MGNLNINNYLKNILQGYEKDDKGEDVKYVSPAFFGEGGIRTHGSLQGTTVFETARFNHSRTSPLFVRNNNHSMWRRKFIIYFNSFIQWMLFLCRGNSWIAPTYVFYYHFNTKIPAIFKSLYLNRYLYLWNCIVIIFYGYFY